jgi:hypothetical protein
MKEILEIIKSTSIGILVLVVLAYFLKVYLEKRIAGLADRVADIGRLSLDLKKNLRNEERKELLDFRVAVEKWEYLLQTLLFDFTMLSPSEAEIAPFYKEDKQLFLDVRIAAVKVSTYLRDKDLEIKLMAAINKIRSTYYPIINESMPRLIDLQAALRPLEYKIKQFDESGMKDMSLAPTSEDREEHLKLQTMMTQEMQRFSERLLKEYQSIAEQTYDLKEAVNEYIYRPVNRVEVDKD